MPKSILITGCSSGIGKHCAIELSKRGYKVIGTVRNEAQLTSLEDYNVPCVLMDLHDLKSVESGFKEALALLGGKLDVLFNNAAFGQCGAVEDLPVEALIKQFNVNVFAWHHLTQFALGVMHSNKSGIIIQNSSVLGFAAMPYRGAYNASKFALEGLTDTLRLELLNTDIKVVLIEPGPIESEFRKNALKAFTDTIDWQQSRYHEDYKKELARLKATGAASKFTLPPSAVCDTVLKAITAKNPKARYRITRPTRVIAILKRILPTRLLDKILSKAA